MIRKASLFAALAVSMNVVMAQLVDDDWANEEETNAAIAVEDEIEEVEEAIQDAVAENMAITVAEGGVELPFGEDIGNADDAVEVEEVAVPEEPLDPYDDEAPMWWVGTSSLFGVIWWFVWGWFVYIPTNVADATMLTITGTNNEIRTRMLPIQWCWPMMTQPRVAFVAAMYITTFLAYMLVSGIEFVGWILYFTGYYWLFKTWSNLVGYYGSMILYFFAWLWPVVQLSIIAGDIYRETYINSIVHASMLLISHIYITTIHIIFNDRLQAHLDARIAVNKDPCACDPFVPSADFVEDNFANCSAATATCTRNLGRDQCKDKLLTKVYNECAIERYADEEDDQYKHRCREASIAACAIPRNEGEQDIDFMVRCRIANIFTCDAPEVHNDIVVVIDEPEVDDDGAGDGW